MYADQVLLGLLFLFRKVSGQNDHETEAGDECACIYPFRECEKSLPFSNYMKQREENNEISRYPTERRSFYSGCNLLR